MSTQIDGGGHAFPFPDIHLSNGNILLGSHGMTLRDYFAAKAMNSLIIGIMTSPNEQVRLTPESQIAEWAYTQADAMLEARKGGGK